MFSLPAPIAVLLFILIPLDHVRGQDPLVMTPLQVLHESLIKDRTSLDHYLQSTLPNYTHALAFADLCEPPPDAVLPGVGTEAPADTRNRGKPRGVVVRPPFRCRPNDWELHYLLDRSYEPRPDHSKTVVVVMSAALCREYEHLVADFERNDYSTLWMGARLAKGPGSQIGDNEQKTCLNDLKRSKHVTVAFFDEWPGSQRGYTKGELAELKRFYLADQQSHFVAMDAYYVQRANPKDVLDNFKSVPIILYQIPGQPLPDPKLLHVTVRMLRSLVPTEDTFYGMLPKWYMDRVDSCLPIINWQQRPSRIQYEFINPTAIAEYMAEGDPYIHLRVVANAYGHYVNDKPEHIVLNVPLNRPLLLVSPNRIMLFEFRSAAEHNQFDFRLYMPGPFFVLLLVLKGPNYNPKDKLLVLKDVKVVPGVTYVLGFREDATGKDKQYKDDHFSLLEKAIDVHKGVDMGVMLSGEFLDKVPYTKQLRKLRNKANLKYLFLRAGQLKNPTWYPNDRAMQTIKYNVRELDKETIVHTTWEMRKRLFKVEPLPEPGPTNKPGVTPATSRPTMFTFPTRPGMNPPLLTVMTTKPTKVKLTTVNPNWGNQPLSDKGGVVRACPIIMLVAWVAAKVCRHV